MGKSPGSAKFTSSKRSCAVPGSSRRTLMLCVDIVIFLPESLAGSREVRELVSCLAKSVDTYGPHQYWSCPSQMRLDDALCYEEAFSRLRTSMYRRLEDLCGFEDDHRKQLEVLRRLQAFLLEIGLTKQVSQSLREPGVVMRAVQELFWRVWAQQSAHPQQYTDSKVRPIWQALQEWYDRETFQTCMARKAVVMETVAAKRRELLIGHNPTELRRLRQCIEESRSSLSEHYSKHVGRRFSIIELLDILAHERECLLELLCGIEVRRQFWRKLPCSCVPPSIFLTPRLVRELFAQIRALFLDEFGDYIQNHLRELLPACCCRCCLPRSRLALTPASVSLQVQTRFLEALRAGKGFDLCPALHGTARSNFASILKQGLLIPGRGNSLRVLHGSAHGLGIYVAKAYDVWLPASFASPSPASILVCGVLDDAVPEAEAHLMGNFQVTASSDTLRHVGSAIIAFDPGRIVPFFEVKKVCAKTLRAKTLRRFGMHSGTDSGASHFQAQSTPRSCMSISVCVFEHIFFLAMSLGRSDKPLRAYRVAARTIAKRFEILKDIVRYILSFKFSAEPLR